MTGLSVDMRPEGWDAAADIYDRVWTSFTRLYAQDALRLAGIERGQRVLDVAAGPGALALLAARAGAEVVATDFSPEMVSLLRRQVAAEGLANITTRVMDGQALDLPDASFDAAFSMFGLIFFPDRVRGFRELWRVLKPGGRAVVAGWSAMERVRFFAPVAQAVRRALPHLPPPASPPPILSLQDPRVFEKEMRAGGFAEVSIHNVTHAWEAPSAETLWETRQGSPGLVGFLETLQPQEQQAVGATLTDILHKEFGDGPVRLEAESHIGLGLRA